MSRLVCMSVFLGPNVEPFGVPYLNLLLESGTNVFAVQCEEEVEGPDGLKAFLESKGAKVNTWSYLDEFEPIPVHVLRVQLPELAPYLDEREKQLQETKPNPELPEKT